VGRFVFALQIFQAVPQQRNECRRRYAATKLAVRTIFEGSRKESNKVRGT